MRLIKILILAVSYFLLLADGMAADKTILIIGKVASPDNDKNHTQMKTMFDYVSDQMSDVGIVKGDVYLAKNHREMIDTIKTEKVDWVTDLLFPALIFADRTNAEMFFRRWEKEIILSIY